jgi:predicted exporter
MMFNKKTSHHQTQNTLAKWGFSLWLLLILGALSYGAMLWQQGAKLQTDILAMLPHLQQDKLTQQALKQVEQQLENQVYLALIADDEVSAIAAADRLMTSLKQDPSQAFSQVTSGADNQLQTLGKLFFEHRYKLLTPAQSEALSEKDWQGLVDNAQQQLYSAFGFASSQLLSQDPLLLFPDNLLAISPNKQLNSRQGILLTNLVATPTSQARVAAIVMAKGSESAFSPVAQEAQLTALGVALDAALSAPQASSSQQAITVLKAGALFHAHAATVSAKQEVSLIGSLSLLGVVLLVWLAFRSLMPLSLALLTLGTGFISAFVCTLSLFGELHLLTLVFGTSLIGVAIDYSFHFYCEKLNHAKDTAWQTLTRILPAMSLALLTSAGAFICIGFTPFPGMQQVAVFCATGLVGAYLTLVLAYPLLANRRLSNTQGLAWAEGYMHWLSLNMGQGKRQALLLMLLALMAIMGLSRLTTNDDIRNLQQSPEQIQLEEAQLRQLLGGGTDNQFLLVRSSSEQGLLEALERLTPHVEAAIDAAEIQQVISLTTLLPSRAKQDKNYRLQAQIYRQHLPSIIAQLGLDEALMPSLSEHFSNAKPRYLLPDDVLENSTTLFRTLWISPSTEQQDYAAIVLLSGIEQLPAFTQRIKTIALAQASVIVVDKVGDISAMMSQYRELTLQLLFLVVILAGVIFSFKYGIKLAGLIVAVPVLSVVMTLASLGLIGSSLSLFHALALILVMGIGIDYSLFFAQAKQENRGVMMAVFMSACSTILAFGLLGLSQTNAIHFFGLTLFLGISFSFLFAPFIAFCHKEDSLNA